MITGGDKPIMVPQHPNFAFPANPLLETFLREDQLMLDGKVAEITTRNVCSVQNRNQVEAVGPASQTLAVQVRSPQMKARQIASPVCNLSAAQP